MALGTGRASHLPATRVPDLPPPRRFWGAASVAFSGSVYVLFLWATSRVGAGGDLAPEPLYSLPAYHIRPVNGTGRPRGVLQFEGDRA